MSIIKEITNAIESVADISLLDVDPGKATNRTVVTFVGTPDDVIEAAFRGIKRAAELIDMRQHKGEHPRFGATDVADQQSVIVFFLAAPGRIHRMLLDPVLSATYYTGNRLTG